MNYINPPSKTPQNLYHEIFYSEILEHEIGYNIYMPEEYKNVNDKYPVTYHIHGWTGNESSEIWPMEKVYMNSNNIFVFINMISNLETYEDALLQIESILKEELIPHIEVLYRVDRKREHRRLSGFSMGGAMAFYYAVKNLDLFGGVTAYAGTYHHLYHKEYRTVGVSPEKIFDIYEDMMREEWYLEKDNILYMLREKVEQIKDTLQIAIHIGDEDILLCDNEIIHLFLEELGISHCYKKYENIAHELEKIINKSFKV